MKLKPFLVVLLVISNSADAGRLTADRRRALEQSRDAHARAAQAWRDYDKCLAEQQRAIRGARRHLIAGAVVGGAPGMARSTARDVARWPRCR